MGHSLCGSEVRLAADFDIGRSGGAVIAEGDGHGAVPERRLSRVQERRERIKERDVPDGRDWMIGVSGEVTCDGISEDSSIGGEVVCACKCNEPI